LLVGLLGQAETGGDTDAEGIGRMLAADLGAGHPWLVPLKGGAEDGPAPVPGVQGAGRT
jgi:hypothetical protein